MQLKPSDDFHPDDVLSFSVINAMTEKRFQFKACKTLSYKISVSTWRRDIVRFLLKIVDNNPSGYILLKKHSSKEDYVESDQ